MAAPQISPMSQLLNSMGLTRQDLSERSDQMRQFLTEPDSESDSDDSQLSRPTTPTNSRSYGASQGLKRSGSLSRGKNASPHKIKSESHDIVINPRPMDNMEQVIERQSREKRARKGKERETAAKLAVSSPLSTLPTFSLDSSLHSRGNRRVQGAAQTPLPADLPPVTPQKPSTYYRDHTHDSSSVRSRKITAKVESPSPSLHRHLLSSSALRTSAQTPTRVKHESPANAKLAPQFATSEMLYQHAKASSSKVYAVPSYSYDKSPLPGSSPPPPSSPLTSSPARRAFILSSSPAAPADYKPLPFTLPKGPYSHAKPEYSYAAMVGQAILSSKEHRLTLQDIYQYITTVYPHYKRGELTWMNSIRHVLSTTVCFRKVVRERSAGRSLWAIWDEDLPCFVDGGFKRSLCADVLKAKEEAAASGIIPAKARYRAPRKRAAPKDDGDQARKKFKTSATTESGNLILSQASPAVYPAYPMPMGYMMPIGYPPLPGNPHQQSYYASCISQAQRSVIPSEIVFPLLPSASTVYQSLLPAEPRGVALGTRSEDTASEDSTTESAAESPSDGPQTQVKEGEPDELVDELTESSPYSGSTDLPPIANVSSPPEPVPELVVDDGSSSSPLLLPSSDVLLTDDEDDEDENESEEEEDIEYSPKKKKSIDSNETEATYGSRLDKPFSLSESSSGDEDLERPDVSKYVSPFRQSSALGPVQFWGEAEAKTISGDSLRPGITLLDDGDDDPEISKKSKKSKGKKKQSKIFPKEQFSLPPLPMSPTLSRKSAMARPCTPPRSLQPATSAIRTPLSFRGSGDSPPSGNFDRQLLVFPSSDPTSSKIDHGDGTIDTENLRTPSRKRVVSGTNASGGSSFPPVTPKKLVFPGAGHYDPSYRTPQGFGGMGMSPFRITPGSRSQAAFFDPHGTGSLLDEELNRIRAPDESPQGMFGKDKKGLLYESPNPVDSSPTRWITW